MRSNLRSSRIAYVEVPVDDASFLYILKLAEEIFLRVFNVRVVRTAEQISQIWLTIDGEMEI